LKRRPMRAGYIVCWISAISIPAVFVSFAPTLPAQEQETYKGRLSPVPIDAKTAPDTTGYGTASAVLQGARLRISGTFEGLRGPATIAQLRQGPSVGVRGPVLFELTVTKNTSGTFSGSFDLTTDQVDSLRKGRLYVQIHSEKAPDGNLWGWLSK
jgi:hypothetical protein